MKISRLFFVLFLCQCILSCGSNKKKPENNSSIVINNISEGDTINTNQLPPNISTWIQFYYTTDTGFQIKNFKSSGVVLHFNDMKSLDSLETTKSLFSNLFSLSPNKKKYIDFLSYGNRLVIKDSPSDIKTSQLFLGEEADQQVVIGEIGGGRKELMFNGPAQMVESADWITENQFFITLISEEENKQIAEIFLFDISTQEYVNYRLDHPFTAPASFNETFIKYWLQAKQINIE